MGVVEDRFAAGLDAQRVREFGVIEQRRYRGQQHGREVVFIVRRERRHEANVHCAGKRCKPRSHSDVEVGAFQWVEGPEQGTANAGGARQLSAFAAPAKPCA